MTAFLRSKLRAGHVSIIHRHKSCRLLCFFRQYDQYAESVVNYTTSSPCHFIVLLWRKLITNPLFGVYDCFTPIDISFSFKFSFNLTK